MKRFDLKLNGNIESLRARTARYSDGSKAIELMSIEREFKYEEVHSRLTVSVGVKPPMGTVWVKTWSENEPMYKELVKQGYLEPTDKTIQCGFAEAVACKLTPKFKEFITEECP